MAEQVAHKESIREVFFTSISIYSPLQAKYQKDRILRPARDPPSL
jgi:hypothetical protein